MTSFSHLLNSVVNFFKRSYTLRVELARLTVKLAKSERNWNSLQAKYDKLSEENSELKKKMRSGPWIELIKVQLDYQKVVAQWNNLVRQINAKGGMSSLNGSSNQFSKEEIKVLIKLCHPDKHDGSPEANDILRKLLQLRK